MEVGARPRSILDQTIGDRSTDLFFQDNRYSSLPRQRTLSTDPPRAGHTIALPCVFIVAGTEQEGKTRPGLEGEPYESESNSVSVLGLVRAPLDLFRIREGGRSLNQWTLMNHH